MTPKRKPARLPGYDYSTQGAYFVTICAADRKPIFGQVCVGQGLAPAEVRLSDLGEAVQTQLRNISLRYDNVDVEKYVVMPNHIHILLYLGAAAGASPCPTLSDVICTFKSLSVSACRKLGFEGNVFQTSFHDHIIRDERDYLRIWQYIDTNAAKWQEDCYFS